MKKISILFLILSLPGFIYSQGIDNLWVMGYQSWAGYPYGGTNINFQNGFADTSYVFRTMNFEETNGVICDSSGNLLFTSNGIYIANAADDTMMNGSGLNPGWFTTQWDSFGLTIGQANLVIPRPGNNHEYYLFHCTIDTPDINGNGILFTKNLFYSIVDMNLDGGLGAVTDKNHLLLQDSLLQGKLTAVKHGNGRDWWIICHKKNDNTYFKFLLTPDSVLGPYPQNIGVPRYGGVGQTVFSPNGEWFAFYDNLDDLDIMQFDRCSGNFYNVVHVSINDSAAGGGAAFSANSNVLYVPSMKYIYQYDITAANIPASQIVVAVWDTFYSPFPPFATLFYLAQLAPDGKIYVICGNSTLDIHVINAPDNLGLACDVLQDSIHLPSYNAFTIPNHPNYFLGADTGSICDSITGIKEIKNNFIFNIYPVPVTGQQLKLIYLLPQNKSGVFEMFDINGRKVYSLRLPESSTSHMIHLPELFDGLYSCVITSGSNRVSKKVAVIKE